MAGTSRKAGSVFSPRTGESGCILEITESDENPASIITEKVGINRAGQPEMKARCWEERA